MPSKNGRVLVREIVTVQDLAAMFLVSERQVQRLTNQGILRVATDSKGKIVRGRYVLGDAVASYVKHLRESVANNPEAKLYEVARRRRMEALAERERLDVMARTGELHHAEHIAFAITSMFSFVRARILAIPARVSRLLVGERDFKKIYETIEHEIRAALTELSEAKYAERMDAQRDAARAAGEITTG